MIEGYHIDKLQTQLLALKVEKPVGSVHIKVHHKTSGVKDDHPDALANACYVARNMGYVQTTASIVNAPKKVSKKKGKTLQHCNEHMEYYWDNCPVCSEKDESEKKM